MFPNEGTRVRISEPRAVFRVDTSDQCQTRAQAEFEETEWNNDFAEIA